MKPTNSVYTGQPTTVFEEMSRLAIANSAINLGQGFPDVDGPVEIRQKAAQAAISGPNQYPPMLGVAALTEAVAASWQRFYGLAVDPRREVLVTSGATEALSDTINALVEPGDERGGCFTGYRARVYVVQLGCCAGNRAGSEKS